ncbi:DNA-binding PadR family transcriptional regulator [Barrientosiimonas humi]|uniref:DNA-binding PadR family transcriptional regulator n=2 Tax=Barrientosiimonas humi TaxID=999931 RepID=A0A542XDU0_9MICO|nr:DNA-binding PadR family transcriptional regulator [Barrientosiimonas humi]CAG7573989.1 hypothetical protein BH39T_PBIAJDOK_02631 [Barrientosiimonas humi]
MSPSLLVMSLPHALLGVLSARPMNGYELSKFFDSAAGWIWSAPQSQIYTTLRRMTDDGWISQEAQTRGTRMRTHVYSITEAGERELREWVATVHDLPSPRDTVLLQALFFDLVDADSAEKVVRAYIEEQESRIARWTGHRDALRARTTPLLVERLQSRPKSQHERIARLKAGVFQGEIDRAEAMVAWARDELEQLRAR